MSASEGGDGPLGLFCLWVVWSSEVLCLRLTAGGGALVLSWALCGALFLHPSRNPHSKLGGEAIHCHPHFTDEETKAHVHTACYVTLVPEHEL